MSLELFHPVIQQWFRGRFAAPTEPQEWGWPDLVAGRDVLIAAPTGSGKTLTAFLAAIDRLLRLAVGGMPFCYLLGGMVALRTRPVLGLMVRLRSSSSATKKTKPLNISS